MSNLLDSVKKNIPKVYQAGYDIGYTEGHEKGYDIGYTEGHEKGYDIGMEESGFSDNLVTPPENAVEGYAFTVNTDGTVTVDAYSESTAVMLYREEIDFLPMENGKKYKLTVTPSVEVSGKADMRWRDPDSGTTIYAFEMDFTEGNSVIFTTPAAPCYVETLHLPCFSDKTVTYTFDLREDLEDKESSLQTEIENLKAELGNVETALDGIIATQEAFIGGETE